VTDPDFSRDQENARGRKPPGFIAIGVFLFFGCLMAGLAATALLWPNTALDRVWTLNPTAHAQLARWGRKIGALFLLVSVALASAGTGWFRRRLWGWRLTVAIIGIQVFDDAANVVRGDFLQGGIGLLIAGALLFYLMRSRVKCAFGNA
jgi:hypothetical protein